MLFFLQIPNHGGPTVGHETRSFPKTRAAQRQLRLYEPPDGMACIHGTSTRTASLRRKKEKTPRGVLIPSYGQEFLVFLLPLLPHRRLRRVAGTAAGALMHPLDALSGLIPASASSTLGLGIGRGQDGARSPERGKFAHVPEDECAICYEGATAALSIGDVRPPSTSDFDLAARKAEPPTHPLVTPYRTSCGHIYCYTCVAEKMLRAADEGGGPWECLRCGKSVVSAERFHIENVYWASEGEGSIGEWGSDYFDEIGSSSLSGVSGISAGSRSSVSGSDEEQSE
jgi:peroxin-2